MKRTIVLLILATLMAGCASIRKMPLESDSEALTPESKPIYLLTVDVKNLNKQRYQPEVRYVHVIRDNPSGKQELLAFSMDSRGTHYGENEDQQPKFLVRLELEPGAYTLRGMYAMGKAFPIVGNFYLPLHAPFQVAGSGVTYLGAVSATVRERQGNEFRAGPSIPLIDQAIAGASTGTFDVTISDRFDEDLALFQKLFPALKARSIAKAVLPPFDRAKAQAFWEAN